MARSAITPATATPNLPQPVGPTATASVAELRLLAGAAMAGAKSTVEKRQWSVRLFAEHLAQFPGQTSRPRPGPRRRPRSSAVAACDARGREQYRVLGVGAVAGCGLAHDLVTLVKVSTTPTEVLLGELRPAVESFTSACGSP
jgi:hypothetical protein